MSIIIILSERMSCARDLSNIRPHEFPMEPVYLKIVGGAVVARKRRRGWGYWQLLYDHNTKNSFDFIGSPRHAESGTRPYLCPIVILAFEWDINSGGINCHCHNGHDLFVMLPGRQLILVSDMGLAE